MLARIGNEGINLFYGKFNLNSVNNFIFDIK